MAPADLLRALRRAWWVPAISAVVAGLLVFAFGGGPPERVSAQVVVGAADDLEGEGARFSAVGSIDAELVNTLADLYTAAAADADGGGTVRATVGPESHTVTVSVEDADGDAAQERLDAVLTDGATQFLDLYDIYRVEIIEPPSTPTAVGPSRGVRVLVAAAIGALFGALLVAGWEWWATLRHSRSSVSTA
jgi:hypothetical protein